RHHARETLRITQCRLQCNRAALGESRDDDAIRGDPGVDLLCYVAVHDVLRLAYSRVVLRTAAAEPFDVIPGPHHVAIVDRHRPWPCMRKNKAYGQRWRQAQFFD